MTSFFKPMFLICAVLASTTVHASPIEGKWFLHKFGELRSYHGDFLDVCAGTGFTKCRAVQYGFGQHNKASIFGDTRLSIARTKDDKYTIEIYANALPDTPKGPMILSIDGDIFQLNDKQWKAGTPEGYNVARTFSITDDALTTKLIDKMHSGNKLRVLHDNFSETRFQLRGFSDALDAIGTRLSN